MLATELLPQLTTYLANPALRQALGFDSATVLELKFLAQGEYNINYLLLAPGEIRYVLRVNVGSQIGQAAGAQIGYEAAALRLLGPQGVAPRLHYVDASLSQLPYGLLVMEYLPGGPLHYDNASQIAAAATTLARLHQVPAPPGSPFITRRPLIDDLAEAQGWLAPYLACARAPSTLRSLLARLLEAAAAQAERHAARFPTPFALVHTDVQAHNWVVSRQPAAGSRQPAAGSSQQAAMGGLTTAVHRPPSTVHRPPIGDHRPRIGDHRPPTGDCRLVDWERPLIDDPSYDLAHFLIPTTTRWKTGYTFSPVEAEFFLAAYCAARNDLPANSIRERLALRRPFILLRAISWCAGAWVEYTGTRRAIDNRDTLAKIEEYLQPGELRALFGEWV